MTAEGIRRDYLAAMGIDLWLPRQSLPHAAPSCAELLAFVAEESVPASQPAASASARAAAEVKPAAPVVTAAAPARQLRQQLVVDKPVEAPPVVRDKAPPKVAAPVVIQRFNLQLLQAGSRMLLVDWPVPELPGTRDPGSLLLRDLLRAVGLPPDPQPLSAPVCWPLFSSATLDQGAEAARTYVLGVLDATLSADIQDIWLLGPQAARLCLDTEEIQGRTQFRGRSTVFLPALEHLLQQPLAKRAVWALLQDFQGAVA